ncbi:MAG: siderophore-interacting protein [Cellvibrio sp.]|uniref:siderophore-interacting protein n=1 Tax=Cellvibrio sp. TaxID=1965322 RepID=UPI0031A564B3
MNSTDAAPTSARAPQRIRLPLRFRKVQVTATEKFATSFIRITFDGDDLEGFDSPGFDDHVKLFFPDATTGELRLPELGPTGPVWPEGAKPVMRDYTPRFFDGNARTLVIDFALHEAGPATAWAIQAKPGDLLGIGGPKGSFIIPTEYDFHLLAGDETAVPAIARRLEELPATTKAIALIEVDDAGDEVPLSSQAQVEIIWCYRKGAVAGTTTVIKDALEKLTLPDGEGYAWIACETKAARVIRSYLVKERNMSSKGVKAAGYWQLGVADAHENMDD